MPIFQYDDAIIRDFPQVMGGVLFASGISNQPTPDDLKAKYLHEQQKAIARIGDTPLSEIESLSAWRSAFSSFGSPPTKYRNAAEALLRRLTKKGDIPSINTLVDIGNLVSIRYGLPVAVFDARHITGTLTVRYAKGNERYTELGSDEVKHPDTGEVIFADDTGLVFARRWCWRQSFQSASKLTTTNAIITVEAQHADSLEAITYASLDLGELITMYTDAQSTGATLDKDNPRFEQQW